MTWWLKLAKEASSLEILPVDNLEEFKENDSLPTTLADLCGPKGPLGRLEEPIPVLSQAP